MAADTQVRLSYSLQDEQGIKMPFNIAAFVDGAQTLTQAKAAWNTFGALLDAITGAKILHGSVTVQTPITFTPKSPTPSVGSEVQEVGNFDFLVTGTRYVYDVAVPSIADSALLTLPLVGIDTSVTAVADFITAVATTAILGGTFTNHSYVDLGALQDTFLSDRKRRKQLAAISRR